MIRRAPLVVNKMKKRIKITNRGHVLTSRGMARTPIDRPYNEYIESILILITRYNANVVEVLPDGTEIPLTIENYATDNSVVKTPVAPAPEMKQPEKVEEKEEAPATFVSKNMSRKERKRLEAERRRASEMNVGSQDHTNVGNIVNDTETVEQLEDVPVE